MKKTIGINTNPPKTLCNDRHCPYHGSISLRGKIFKGMVVSDKASKTVTVEWTRTVEVPKYEHRQKKKSKVKAHNPECIHARKGQQVIVMETRSISKTKKFVVIEVTG